MSFPLQIHTLCFLAVLILTPLSNAAPIQQRDATVDSLSVAVYFAPGIIVALAIGYMLYHYRRQIVYKLAYGENLPTHRELVFCWDRFGPKVLLPGNFAPISAPGTHEDMMRCWGVGPGSNGRMVRDDIEWINPDQWSLWW
jgi:hypothetical protein